MGRSPQFDEQLLRGLPYRADPAPVLARLGYLAAVSGRAEEARRSAADLRSRPKTIMPVAPGRESLWTEDAATLLSLSLQAEDVAQAQVSEVQVEAATTSGVDRPRLRLGVGGGVVAGIANGVSPDGKQQVSAGSLAPELQLDLGIQINRHGALYLHGGAGSIFLANHATGYLVGEWTPLRWLSVGTGVGVDGMAILWPGGGAEPSSRARPPSATPGRPSRCR